MLNCKDVTDLASDYVDRNLSFGKRLSVMMHLAICVYCRRYVRHLRATLGALGKLPAPEPSEQDVDQTVEKLLGKKQ